MNHTIESRQADAAPGAPRVLNLPGFSLELFAALACNFLIMRVYSRFKIPDLTLSDLAFGYASDLVMSGFVSIIAGLFGSLLVKLLKKAPRSADIVFRSILVLFSLFIGAVTHSYLEFYLFSGLYLSPSLFTHYFLQINFFAESLKADSFNVAGFATILAIWVCITVASFRISRHEKTVAALKVIFPVLFFAAVAIRLVADISPNIRENFFTYYATYHLKPLNAATWPSAPPSPIEDCLSNRYDFPDPQFPFMRTAKKDPPPPAIPASKKPRIILVFMESFAAKQLDRERADGKTATPEFDRLLKDGYYFTAVQNSNIIGLMNQG
jgi:phosphoglycerol transferase MdoB-like AlkP superfamily enzyme